MKDKQSPEGRETDIVQSLIRMADTLVSDYDPIALLTDLAESCVRILDVDAAGVSLGEDSTLRFVAASSETMEMMELYQIERHEGPCFDAYSTGMAVATSDLETNRSRWPKWAAKALESGYQAAAAFPLRLRDETIGALNIYSSRIRELNKRDVDVGRGLADMATIGLLHEGVVTRNRVVQDQLQFALDSRVVIEQAKGMLAERHGILHQDAFDRIRNHARKSGLRLRDVAAGVVQEGLDL